MAQQVIDTVGATDDIASGGNKINANFAEVYTSLTGKVVLDANGELTQDLAGAAAQVSSGIPLSVKLADGTWKDTNDRVIPPIFQTLPIPAANIKAHDFFDNTGDSAWIDRCADKSWENEHISLGRQHLAANYANDAAALAANSTIVNGDVYYTGTVFNEYGLGATTRGSSRKFPMSGLVTVEATRVIVWSTTGGVPEMWMVFNRVPSGTLMGWPGATVTSSIAIKSSHLVLGNTSGIIVVEFAADSAWASHLVDWQIDKKPISSRNTQYAFYHGNTVTLVNGTVNDVAITFLPDAPLDEYSMKIPTIAVATNGDTSIINNDGSVVNHTSSWVGSSGTQHVAFAPNGSLITVEHSFISGGATGIWIHPVSSFLLPSANYANGIVEFTNNTSPSLKFGGAAIQSIVPNIYATSSGLVLHRNNPSAPSLGMVAYITSLSSSGWLVGDIQTCLVGGVASITDMSVKALTPAALTAPVYTINGQRYWFKDTAPIVVTLGTTVANGQIEWWELVAGVPHHYVANISAAGATLTSGYVDGVAGTPSTNVTITAGTTLTIAANIDVDLVRASATAATAEQLMYSFATEHPTMIGSNCLLSNSSNVTSLAYDAKHDTYYVENGTNTDEFKGLQRIDSAVTATGVTTSGNALAAPVLMGNVLKAPAIDINSELTAIVKPPRTVFKKISSDGSSVLVCPKGFKPVRITSAGGTYISLSTNVPKYDGFLYSITTGLVLNTNYDVEMIEVTQ